MTDSQRVSKDDPMPIPEQLAWAIEKTVAVKDREIEILRSATELDHRLIKGLEAELAALKETMDCGHRKACLRTVRVNDGYGDFDEQFCTACAQQEKAVRLAVAAALRAAAAYVQSCAEGGSLSDAAPGQRAD